MKNQILLAVLAVTVLACSNSAEKVVSMDAKSLKVKSHIEAYMNNDSSVAEAYVCRRFRALRSVF